MTVQEWYLCRTQMMYTTVMKSNSSIDNDIGDDNVIDDENDDDDDTSSDSLWLPAKQGSSLGPTERTAWPTLAT